MAAASLSLASPASAATVYEITGGWAENTPTEVAKGDVINAEWRVNVNDDAEAPANEPVENVTFTVTLEHGLFQGIPDLCKTTGVDPVSALSDDKLTLTCNLGPVLQGTAVVVQTPVVADGITGDIINGSAEIDGQTAELTPITIRNTFGMDMLWGTPTATQLPRGDAAHDFDFEWTLFADAGSDQGPDTVSYDLTITTQNNKELFLGVQNNAAPFNQPCGYFAQSNTAVGHPYSHQNPNAYGERQAPFVDECTLTKTGRNTFRMTLTGIDYSQTMVPTQDSAGRPLPADRVALASGSIWLQVRDLTEGTSANLRSTAPVYRSVTGQTSQDLAGNNTSSKVLVLPGTWSHAWSRTTGGTSWDNSYEMAPGAQVVNYTNDTLTQQDLPANTAMGECVTLDTAYVDYRATRVFMYTPGDPVGTPETDIPGQMQWYVGNDPTVTPGSGGYNPDAFRGCGGGAGWVNEEPADLTTVKAVRWAGFTTGDLGNQFLQLRVFAGIEADAPIGQDIWTWGAMIRNGVWNYPARGALPQDQVFTPTPGDRYTGTRNGRDILHVIFAVPSVRKAVDRSVVRPGEPATFTLTYSANGSGAIPDTVDGYRIVDTLPVGMTYVAGSSDPEPTITTDAQRRQVLTWVLNGVPTNTPNVLTYQSVAGDTVEPGQTLTNTVTTTLRGETSRPATAQVTTSSSGYTLLAKTTDQWFIGNPEGTGDGEGSWTVSLRSVDPLPQAYTDTIDVLPYVGDERGTSYTGTYEVTSVDVPAGATVYYTTADPSTINDDPAHESNGAAGDPSGNDIGWSTTPVPNPTAVRVIGGVLDPGTTFSFKVNIATDGAEPGDVWVNRAQTRAEHTGLVMRTSEPLTMGTYYSASLKKYVQDINGEWHDANDAADYPRFRIGDTIKYRIVVENTGQGTIRNLTVSDDKQPELGAFVVEELEPEGTETHEYEIVASDSLEQTSVNTACAAADQPEDSEEPVQVNCDPAGIEMVGDPTHEKSLISAEPIGDGQWEVIFGLDVTNEDPFATTYDLDDTLHFTEQATITSAVVSVAPDGLTLAEPEWDGQDNVRIASDVPLLALDDALYAPHHYEVTVIADVPLQLEGAGSGEDDPTRCGEDGDTADRAFNNVSMLTDPTDTVEEDQACAEIPSISIEKTISAEPTQLGGDRWSVVYDIVATNDGGAAGEYAVYDKLLYGSGIEIESADVVTAPEGVTPEDAWTGLGDDATSAPNLVASGVTLESDAAHTYQVRVVVTAEAGKVTPSAATCPEPGSGGRGGLANSATIEHNGNTASDDVCPTVPGLSSALAVTGQNVDGAAFGLGAMLLLLGGILVYRRRKQAA
ncbi:DUF11 domain-containing protein [Labedella phragmitis]|nr:DUF11 domain-containing protein [Labedella phragmitis]